MYSFTSRSDLPEASCSRIWLRRSTASGALESASVWFWQTRQRSSCASAAVRFSTEESSPRTLKDNTSKKRNLAARIQFLHQRRDLLLRDFGRERADVLVADHPVAVDNVGFRHAVDAVVDADAAGGVEHRELERIAVAREPRQRVLAGVLVVEADHGRDLRFRQRGDHRMLHQAGRAPRP